ncbi:MAG: N-acetyl-gamma-glutamyl-phosphate reductase [Campylobacter sp.]|nr:N-acetyl-gamma-glutamyl-phosphate reductase [Campylobacter sp.]
MTKRVGIIGVSGYTGLELIKMILTHPYMELTYLAASSQSEITELFPSLSGILDIKVEAADAKEASKRCDLVFLALPHKTAMSFASEILSYGIKVVDLSADYRLSLENYEKFYTTHSDKENLSCAVYGLVELNRDMVKGANLVANPGCYPTASILALAPFLDYIDDDIFISALSGLSGAGKGLKQSSHFVNANENMNAYSPLTHRHAPEITEQLEKRAKRALNVSFVPHLVPLTRGMLVSAFASLKSNIDATKILENFYKDEKFIRVRSEPVNVKNVVGTHFCDIFVKQNGKYLFINSAIDNLLKGASSQAVANANIMFGFDELLALPKISYGL